MSGPATPTTIPPLAEPLRTIWTLILDLAERLSPDSWALVGGQMVMLHGLIAGRAVTRTSQDVDVLADLVASDQGLHTCVRALRDLGLDPVPDSSGRVYRFTRASDGARADLLAPDRFPPRRRLRTVGGDTIAVPGGTQALQRVQARTVALGDRSASVPVPDLLGALVLKAAAWAADSRDRDRHSGDAAFLVSLLSDPLEVRARFKGSDRSRLLRLDQVLGDADAREWRQLGESGPDAHTTWRLLVT